ncbi:MAG TPA: ThiF family adenylyltransferase [Flavobacteriaceae bacterium]|nr:ThiF family adenylyltransferase [Flavobacteriaceae bacterium]
MDDKRLKDVRDTIQNIPFVEELNWIEQDGIFINGEVAINFEELDEALLFNFKISPVYPLKNYEQESITFYNEDLISYNHVMESGNICIHTSHSTNLKEKIRIDFESLREWIVRYYLKEQKDLNYEHILVEYSSIDDQYFSFLFNETYGQIPIGDFGWVELSSLNRGVYKNKKIENYFIKKFISSSGIEKKLSWSKLYDNSKITNRGVYYFLNEPPASYGKFALKNLEELDLPTDFLEFLHHFEKDNLKRSRGRIVPLLLGYRINKNESHWQTALLEIGKFPLRGIPIKKDGKKTGKWTGELISEKIQWGLTRNVSYKYFFGRGVFSEEITQRKILIIGIGAVGSIVAKTLTRVGCRYIDLIDYDVKEPENVCRSEYDFFSGISAKTEELKRILAGISPYVDVGCIRSDLFEEIIKSFYQLGPHKKSLQEVVNKYDLIIDCSTDNDLMYVLDAIGLEVGLLNMSITNHAKEMVCAFTNIYDFVNNQFSNVLQNDTEDLYEPTGCWNPTFKANYNDINVLVQYALNHINRLYDRGKAKNNFVISNNDGALKLDEF